MKKLLILFFIILSSQAFPQKYVLVWSDEFNTPGLPDSTKWGYEVGKIRNSELQYYTSKRIENARIEDTVLVLEARKENYNNADYTSASIISKNIGDWKYGKIEVRAKVPTGKGTWPAIWMLPTNYEYGEWSKSGEIDIMEYIGVEPQNLYYTAHFEGTGASGHESSGSGPINYFQNPWEQFIKFTLVWTPEKLEWYANDIKFYTYNKPSDDYRVWPFNKEFYLILNLAYGGSWGGYDGVDDTKLPHQFLIDYVRVYQLQDAEGPFSLNVEPAEGGTVEISPELDSYPEGTKVTLTATPDDNFNFQRWQYMSGANPFTFTINKNTTVNPVFKNRYEMLTNNNFDSNWWTPWAFFVSDTQTASYAASIENGQFVIDITKSPETDWQLGFQELGIPMQKGKYNLTFDAMADEAKTLLITVSKNYPDYGAIVTKYASISTTMQHFEMPIEMPVDDLNSRLYFGIGNFAGKFIIDNISLFRVDSTSVAIRPEIDMNNEWSVFPNPASKKFKIVFNETSQYKERVIQIHSIEGKLLFSKKTTEDEININTNGLKPGVYLISLITPNSNSTRRLIIR